MSGGMVENLGEGEGGSLQTQGGSRSLKDVGKGLSKALQEKNRLLAYDKDTVRRTKVIDDQADYFRMDADMWMSPEERIAAKKLKEQTLADLYTPRSQRAAKMSLDFAGRQVVEETREELPAEEQEKIFQELVQRTKRALYTGAGADCPSFSEEGVISQGGIEVREGSGEYITPQYVEHDGGLAGVSGEAEGGVERRTRRMQDHSGMTELAEGGHCLSMHQPYASMLVRGIKKHEGRSWYSGHRGVLWIAATARQSTREEAKELENFYLRYYNDNLPAPFPEYYPSACLLGCVDVLDCLPQEQYIQQFPGGESESTYVLICEDAKELPVKMPVRGQHKIYKLDPNIHQAAKKLIGQGFQVSSFKK